MKQGPPERAQEGFPSRVELFKQEFESLLAVWKSTWTDQGTGPMTLTSRTMKVMTEEQLQEERPEMEARKNLIDCATKFILQMPTTQERVEIIKCLETILVFQLNKLDSSAYKLLADIFKETMGKIKVSE